MQSSLYVGDLSPKATEAILYSLFSAVGPVASIRICRDYHRNDPGNDGFRSDPGNPRNDENSLCYAYVNFHRAVDAERALDTLNYHVIVDRPCRIMWSQRDPRLRKSGEGNIFVSNLSKEIDNRTLMDTFSWFGDILSCKVACDPKTGQSFGYGFVHYANEESAQKAIEKVNGMVLDGQQVYVTKWKSKQERREREDFNKDNYVSVYVKNFPDEWRSDDLKKVAEEFGEINSCTIQLDESGKSKGFGFINFKESAAAKKCVELLNDREVPVSPEQLHKTDGGEEDNKQQAPAPATQRLYAARAQTKAERQKELREKFATLREQEANRNLYVKGLLDSVDDDQLKAVFSSIGVVQSCRVMRERNNVSKGFGFVLYATEDNAQAAIAQFHSKEIHGIGGPLHVAIAKKKKGRGQDQHMQQRGRGPGGRFNNHQNGGRFGHQGQGPHMNGAGRMNGPQGAGPWVQHPYNAQLGPAAPQFGYNNGNWTPNSLNGGFGYPAPGNGGYGNVPTPTGGQAPYGGFMPFGRGVGLPHMGYGGLAGSSHPSGATSPTGGQAPSTNGLAGAMMAGPQPGAHQMGGQGLAQGTTQIMHHNVPPKEQKQLIGEKIFQHIEKMGGEHMKQAGKITGMLLEMDSSALISLLHQPELLNKKIDQAAEVLRKFQDNAPDGTAQTAVE